MTAEERFSQIRRQEKEALKERQKAEQQVTDKMARLRLLRLAKEEADRAEGALKPPKKAPVRPRKAAEKKSELKKISS